MAKHWKRKIASVLLICAEGIGVLIVSTIMEGFYQVAVKLGYLDTGMELVLFWFGITMFIFLVIKNLLKNIKFDFRKS